jgi:F-box domain.
VRWRVEHEIEETIGHSFSCPALGLASAGAIVLGTSKKALRQGWRRPDSCCCVCRRQYPAANSSVLSWFTHAPHPLRKRYTSSRGDLVVMAPLLVTPRQGQQDQIQPVLAQQQTDTSALDLGHVVSVQLINKTDRLTLLGHSPSELPSDMSVQCSLVIRQLSGHNVQGSGDVEMESKKPCGSWKSLLDLPNEILLHILSYVDVCDLLSVSRVCPPYPLPP